MQTTWYFGKKSGYFIEKVLAHVTVTLGECSPLALNDLYYKQYLIFLFLLQKPANILVMGEGPERGRVKIGKED